jgi:Zn-dependent protease with chaperone function
MFSNFLYFITALVIYTTSELFESENKFDNTVLFDSLIINILFVLICQIAFNQLKKKIKANPYGYFEHIINSYISRLSIFALTIFAINLYALKLNLVFSGIAFFDLIPTLKALIFLCLFLFYLIVIWNAAYGVQKQNFAGRLSKKEFILSNISFSIPALLPWFCLSIIADLVKFLPWQGLNNLLNTTAGEIGYIALFIVAISIFGPLLIQKLWNCKPLEPGISRTRIENVCKKANLKYANILSWKLFGGTMITAGVMGIIARFRYILVTPALLNSLNGDEIDAVVQHEIGHVQKHHLIFYLLFFAGFMACNFLFFEPVMLLLYIIEPVYRLFELIDINKNNTHSILISATLIGFFILYFRFGFGFYMRNFERQADLHVYNFTQDASSLISTFYKIASFSRQSIDKPNWHHFSIGQRVRFLEKCQTNPELIQKHHLWVKKIITGYFVLIILLFGIGYSLNFGMAKETFGNFIAEKILYQQLEVDPENADLYTLVGDYYYSRENYEKAIYSYENVLMIKPDSVHALNNLAWLFATCPQKKFQNRDKALEYSSRALEQKREAFILDTYAHACFINSDIKNAIKAAKEALAISKNKKEYYRTQLQKFQQILDSNGQE